MSGNGQRRSGQTPAVWRGDTDAAMRYALGREQAGALGRAGRRLETALAACRRVEAEGRTPGEALLRRVADEAFALLVQREVAGLGAGNLAWLRAEYDLPEAVVNRLGVCNGPVRRRARVP